MADLYRLYVLELDDGVCARRDPNWPNLYVGRTEDPERKLSELLDGKGRPKWVHGHLRTLRMDLVPVDLPGGSKKERKELVRRLRSEGYTVNRDTKTYRVYVIDLDDAGLPGTRRTSGYKGWVYVGETSLPVEQRVEQHMNGARNERGRLYNKKVRDFGVGLNEELTPGRVFFSRRASRMAEKQLADELRAQGYVVEGGR